MKKQTLLFILGLFLVLPFVSLGQTDVVDSTSSKATTSSYGPKKGEFHIGLTDFASLEDGGSKVRIMPRFGYMISDMDLVFIDFTYVYQLYRSHEGFNIESSINYRRYFSKGVFRPFVQVGAGVGYREFTDIRTDINTDDQYFKVGTGAGVSYRYKKWSFETGIQMNYNEYGSGRVQMKPMVGVSFTF